MRPGIKGIHPLQYPFCWYDCACVYLLHWFFWGTSIWNMVCTTHPYIDWSSLYKQDNSHFAMLPTCLPIWWINQILTSLFRAFSLIRFFLLFAEFAVLYHGSLSNSFPAYTHTQMMENYINCHGLEICLFLCFHSCLCLFFFLFLQPLLMALCSITFLHIKWYCLNLPFGCCYSHFRNVFCSDL